MKKILKICTAMTKWNFQENVSGNNGTLFSYVDLPSISYTMELWGIPLYLMPKNTLCGPFTR